MKSSNGKLVIFYEYGVRQGCILSPQLPQLFNIYWEHILRQVLEDWKRIVIIGENNISNLRYSKDTIFVAVCEEKIIALIQQVKNTVHQRVTKST